ncbi:MAG: hypothetical protein JWO38_2291, partial [Gemmataceae bacterium]|nr:hypothetical protein [Gemmataceae bacterium]
MASSGQALPPGPARSHPTPGVSQARPFQHFRRKPDYLTRPMTLSGRPVSTPGATTGRDCSANWVRSAETTAGTADGLRPATAEDESVGPDWVRS